MSTEQGPVDGGQSRDIAGTNEIVNLTTRLRAPLVDALVHTERPFADAFEVVPHPVVNGMDVRVSSYMVNYDNSYPPGIGPNREVHLSALRSGVGSISTTFSAPPEQSGQALFNYYFFIPRELSDMFSHLLDGINLENMDDPAVIVSTYGHEDGIQKTLSREVIVERTKDNAHHFDNLEKLEAELRARREED